MGIENPARRARTVAAWVLFVGSIIGWPLSQLTIAKSEPPFILGLSWLAVILTSLDLLSTSQVHEEQGEEVAKENDEKTKDEAQTEA